MNPETVILLCIFVIASLVYILFGFPFLFQGVKAIDDHIQELRAGRTPRPSGIKNPDKFDAWEDPDMPGRFTLEQEGYEIRSGLTGMEAAELAAEYACDNGGSTPVTVEFHHLAIDPETFQPVEGQLGGSAV